MQPALPFPYAPPTPTDGKERTSLGESSTGSEFEPSCRSLHRLATPIDDALTMTKSKLEVVHADVTGPGATILDTYSREVSE